MLKRIKQVVSALTAEIYTEDKQFIQKHLEENEQKLFWSMNLPDQRHALNVAYTAIQFAKKIPNLNKEKLIKMSLLHDVGKVRGDVSTLDKIITVVAYNFAPNWSEKWGKHGKGNKIDNLRHAFYIYFYHPKISKEKLKAVGLTDLAELVSRHHEAPTDDDPLELVILREADDAN